MLVAHPGGGEEADEGSIGAGRQQPQSIQRAGQSRPVEGGLASAGEAQKPQVGRVVQQAKTKTGARSLALGQLDFRRLEAAEAGRQQIRQAGACDRDPRSRRRAAPSFLDAPPSPYATLTASRTRVAVAGGREGEAGRMTRAASRG